jgi:hypothetical protein
VLLREAGIEPGVRGCVSMATRTLCILLVLSRFFCMKKGVWNVKGLYWGREDKAGCFSHLARQFL